MFHVPPARGGLAADTYVYPWKRANHFIWTPVMCPKIRWHYNVGAGAGLVRSGSGDFPTGEAGRGPVMAANLRCEWPSCSFTD